MLRLLAAAGVLLTVVVPPVAAQNLQLERAVLLSRHGVRSPTQSNAELDRQVTTPFPVWKVAPGDLTPRGYELMKYMGSFYRVVYSGLGLISPDRCPPSGMVAAWADVDQRTRETAQALLEGLYPQCKIIAQYQSDLSRPDPLFSPVKAGVCPIDEAQARNAILKRVGGSIQTQLDMYAPQYSRVQEVLCPGAAADTRCGLREQQTRIVIKDGRVGIDGPVRTASTMTEIFLLEAAQGLPASQVAWGRLHDFAELRDLMFLHKVEFDLTQRTHYIAQRSGSAMMAAILDGLQRTDDRRLTMFVGHDTNIANIAGLLDIHWVIPGFTPDDPSPGGALAFELLRNTADGARYVRLVYYAQTLDQMRAQTQFSFADLAARAEISLPGCEGSGPANACPMSRFLEIASATIDRTCAPSGKSR